MYYLLYRDDSGTPITPKLLFTKTCASCSQPCSHLNVLTISRLTGWMIIDQNRIKRGEMISYFLFDTGF